MLVSLLPTSPNPACCRVRSVESQSLLWTLGTAAGKSTGWEAGDLDLILAWPLTGCVNLGKFLPLSGPRGSAIPLF